MPVYLVSSIGFIMSATKNLLYCVISVYQRFQWVISGNYSIIDMNQIGGDEEISP